MSLRHQPLRACLPGRRLLLIQNPGRGSRNYLEGIKHALIGLGIQTTVLELHEIWSTNTSDPASLVRRISQILVEQRIGAVLGYGFNGMNDIPADQGPLPAMRSFFEIRNIPHLMLWLDHPQWHADLVGLAPQLQGMFRSGNCYHFMKNRGHALEMERMVGWPNCFELPAGVAPEQFPLSPRAELSGDKSIKPEFDLVAICSEKGEIAPWLKEFAALDEPDPHAIREIILKDVLAELNKLWLHEVPDGIRPEVIALGREWAVRKARQPFLAATRHWPALIEQFPGAAWYLTLAYPTYMNALRILWHLREWERRFYLAYLSRYFRVGVFGGDWSAMGLGPSGRVDFLKQSDTYARGRVALNITDGHDEEGLTMKPFEIAASGVPMLHYHAEGLSDCYEPGRDVMVFESPREARQKLDALLDDSSLRVEMARAARERTLREHSWRQRIVTMFELARLPIECFQATPSPAAKPAQEPALAL